MAQDMFRIDDDLPDADRHTLNAARKTLWAYEPLRATRPILDLAIRDGRLHLEGRVRTRAIKEIVEFLLMRVDGVRAVRNDLVADPDVVRAVADAFALDPEFGPACPIVDARDGVVILIGELPSDEAVRRAVELAGDVPTVASVESHLRVRSVVASVVTNGAAGVLAGERGAP